MKETTQGRPAAPEVKILSEREIQNKLYGSYLGRRKPAETAAVNAASTHTISATSARPQSPWTGSEILSGELERLRSELILLRQEKDSLAHTIRQMNRSVRTAAPEASAETRAPRRFWVGRLAAAGMVLGILGYVASASMLQASPAAGDPTPYTVQVAVYDSMVPAQLAVQFLEDMSYRAFLTQVTRKDGKMRYRICVGGYVTKDEADLERLRLIGDPRFGYFKDAFVRLR